MATPPDDLEKARVHQRQLPVFAREGRAVCDEVKLSGDVIKWLRRDGFLSFDPAVGELLDEAREAELRFVGALVAAGCTRAALRQLLVGLSKPYAYDVRKIYFDWSEQCWRVIAPHKDAETIFFDFLDEVSGRQERDVLLRIRGLVDDALDLTNDRVFFFAHEQTPAGSGDGVAHEAE